MSKRPYTPSYPTELRDRGVRLFKEHRAEYPSDNAAYRAIAPKLGCSPDSLRVCLSMRHEEPHLLVSDMTARHQRSPPRKIVV